MCSNALIALDHLRCPDSSLEYTERDCSELESPERGGIGSRSTVKLAVDLL
jgi:hypothetical protein